MSADSNDLPLLKTAYEREDLWFTRLEKAQNGTTNPVLVSIDSKLDTLLATNAQVPAVIEAIRANQLALANALEAQGKKIDELISALLPGPATSLGLDAGPVEEQP